MDTLAIVLLVVAAVLAALLIGGLAVTRSRAAEGAADYSRHVAAADQALEEARATDRGWDRAILDKAARAALAQERPDFSYEQLHLVLVEDRPGVEEDRAHYAAVGAAGEVRVVLVRGTGGWYAENVA